MDKMADIVKKLKSLSDEEHHLIKNGHGEQSADIQIIKNKIKAVKRNHKTNQRRKRLKKRREKSEDFVNLDQNPKRNIDALQRKHNEFDEFGAIIFKVNADDIVVAFPDFNKKLVIEKSNQYSYEDLITDTVFKLAVNKILYRNRVQKNGKDFIEEPLESAIPASSYDEKFPKIDLFDLDNELDDVKPPIFTFISINITDVFARAEENTQPLKYKKNIWDYTNETSYHDNPKALKIIKLYEGQCNVLLENIVKKETERKALEKHDILHCRVGA